MSKIEWTEHTWNPIAGCSMVSEGCKNCYAMSFAHRMKANPKVNGKYTELTEVVADRPIWNGNIRLMHTALKIPFHWKSPSKIFVNSMSDLFHEQVPFDFIAEIFKVMAGCGRHTFQILTKRPERMVEYFKWMKEPEQFAKYFNSDPLRLEALWPMSNVWIGVSVENQETANERIPLLLQTPAAVRFISAEPLLGPIDLTEIRDPVKCPDWLRQDVLSGKSFHEDDGNQWTKINKLDWVIVGGESGNHARPMHPDWVRSIRDQCVQAKVPFFFKQWGEFIATKKYKKNSDDLDEIFKKKGNFIFEIGDEFQLMERLGKRKAGRVLDGKFWDEMPS